MVIGYGCFLYKGVNKYFCCTVMIETNDYESINKHPKESNTVKYVSSNYKILKIENIRTNSPDININVHDFLQNSKIKFYLHKKIAIDRFLFRYHRGKYTGSITLYGYTGTKEYELFLVNGKTEGYPVEYKCSRRPCYINGATTIQKYHGYFDSDSDNDYWSDN